MNKAIAILFGALGVVWVSTLDILYRTVVALEHDAWTDFLLAIIALGMILVALGLRWRQSNLGKQKKSNQKRPREGSLF